MVHHEETGVVQLHEDRAILRAVPRRRVVAKSLLFFCKGFFCRMVLARLAAHGMGKLEPDSLEDVTEGGLACRVFRSGASHTCLSGVFWQQNSTPFSTTPQKLPATVFPGCGAAEQSGRWVALAQAQSEGVLGWAILPHT